MQTNEKITVTLNTLDAVEACYYFDAKHSDLMVTTPESETYLFGAYERTYWFNEINSITHTQLQFDENWVEPEEVE